MVLHDEEHDDDMTLPLSSDKQGPQATQDRDPCIHVVDIIMEMIWCRWWIRHRHPTGDFR